MPKLIDLTGLRFGRLIVIERAQNHITPDGSPLTMWKCRCDCGKEIIAYAQSLRIGDTKSCGCYGKDTRSERSLKDLTGKIYGRLTVIKRAEDIIFSSGRCCVAWLCKCECGNDKIANANSLQNGYLQSCGCLALESITNLRRLEYKEASFRRVLKSYQRGAKKRNLEFAISDSIFKTLIFQNCFYCGAEPKMYMIISEITGGIFHNGVDRIDSSKGYIEGNVVTACTRCNCGKMSVPIDTFYVWIDNVYHYSAIERNFLLQDYSI